MEIDEIIRWQRKRQFLWRSVPFEGRDIKLGALAFRVYPGVSWPFEDSLPLIENMCINQGDSVLDVGTGTGNIAIHAALKGAGRVLALDRNSAAVAAARENAKRHGVSDRIEARGSDVFSALGNEPAMVE
jgi:release factor glutamine methyltransferase